MEKETATHSSILAWGVLWTEEPVGLPSMGLHRVRHDWSNLACVRALEKELATHSGILAWRIPGTGEPGGLLSMGSHRVGHDWSDLAAAAAYDLYLSLTDLLHSKEALDSSTSLELTQMCSFLWLSNIPLCICTTAALSVHLSMDI